MIYWGLCKKLNIIYNIISCNPEPVRLTNESFFWTSSPKCLKPFVARAAEIHKLLDQNSLWDAWLWFEMSRNIGVSDSMMNELIQCSSSSNSSTRKNESLI